MKKMISPQKSEGESFVFQKKVVYLQYNGVECKTARQDNPLPPRHTE
jgi:hypothetical protein